MEGEATPTKGPAMSDHNEHDPFTTPPPGAQPPPGAPHRAPPPPLAQPGMGDFAAPPPMPPSPYGYGAPAPMGSNEKNFLGILALIFPFVGLSLVGIIMGHLGLSAVKKGTANNRGVALAGTVISWVFTVFAMLGIGGAIAFAVVTDQQDEVVTQPDEVVPFSALSLGDCIADPYDNAAQEADGSSWIEGVVIVDCTTVHYGEVYAVVTMEGDGAYVEEDVYAQADDLCYFAFEDYLGVSYEDSLYYYDPFYPTADSWALGDRETTCIVTTGFSDTEGTLQGSGL
jgi:hypothetical protein